MLNYIDVHNGGQISFEYMGCLLLEYSQKSGKSTYVLRIATGKLAGSSFTFAKRGSEQLNKVQKKIMSARQLRNKLQKKDLSQVKELLRDLVIGFKL